jgi:hypothetical protein
MIPCTIELYDNNIARKNTFQTGSGNLSRCEFSHGESGCLGFSLLFGKEQSIEETDIVKIKLYDSSDYFYTGVVRKTPIAGSSKTNYIYSGFGFNDYLGRLNAQTQSFSSQTLTYIFTYLLDNIITPSSPIEKDVGLISLPAVTMTTFDINYTPMPEVLDTIKKIANSEGDYIYGVNREGKAFFQERSTALMATLVVGASGDYGIPEYNPGYSDEPISKIYLLDKDGVYINSYTSSEDIDINELKLTAPDIDNTSAGRWAQGELAQREVRRKRAPIRWAIEDSSPTLLIADGRLRIISIVPPTAEQESGLFGAGDFGSGPFGGYAYTGYNLDDTLRVMQVRYVISSTEAMRYIEIGTMPVSLDEQIIELKKKLTELTVSLGR